MGGRRKRHVRSKKGEGLVGCKLAADLVLSRDCKAAAAENRRLKPALRVVKIVISAKS
jgi:hypothetical protein